ncbi:conserved phage C-terminal domain-containing protein [Liquorilactobacillus satsumensis]|uniref:conserved phage C-terminal domain-containing protein n=1 Tax=Liquorilactobacillus satsumensis TaxID=259059 RepID=UPI0021C44715|nr:conserved phage C-terminal domain-containing protein [Liquorilactobacillus satsumensis]
MNKYLFDEYPLVILPQLAEKIGLNEAIMLQQINYWLQKSDKIRDGKKWTYNSYAEWGKQFPFWSITTIRRTLKSLEKQELIITGNFNKYKFDKTKWYTIDVSNLNRRCAQNEQMDISKLNNSDVSNLDRPIPDTTDTSSETTTETYSPAKAEPHVPYSEIVEYLNQKASTGYKATTKKTQQLVKARFNEGFNLDDFKKVIDNKTMEWKNTDMAKFLRPETLFGTKFESYLNQKVGAKSNRYNHFEGEDDPSVYDNLPF